VPRDTNTRVGCEQSTLRRYEIGDGLASRLEAASSRYGYDVTIP
jgi:hypothetical protein